MSDTIDLTIHKLVDALAKFRSIRTIGLSGGDRPLPEAGEGDIDLFVYCIEIPTTDQRQELLSSLTEVEHLDVGKLEGGHWRQGDCFLIAGVETWLLYFTLAETRAELEAILDGQYLGRLDDYYYPIGRCAMWKEMKAIYDPDGFLGFIKQCIAEYPQRLALAVIAHHVKALEDIEDLERAVQRKDVFFFHFALDLALDHFMQALFALNREYFPGRKRSQMHLQTFKVKPLECEGHLRQIVALGGNAETLDRAYLAWKPLVQDLKSLTEDLT